LFLILFDAIIKGVVVFHIANISVEN